MINPKFLFLIFIIPNLCFAQIVESFDSPLGNEWTVVDERGTISGPSNWATYKEELIQTKNIYKYENRKGTFIYYVPGLAMQDTSFQWTQKSYDNDGIGFMFRGTTINNYYRFSTNLQANYRRLEKNVGGKFTTLAEDSVTYTRGVAQAIRIDAIGDQIQVYVDGNLVFDVTDSSHPKGTFAFYSFANNAARFDDLVVDILQDPTSQCSDGIDNDSDGLIDYPNDPGCLNADDNDESNTPPASYDRIALAGCSQTRDWVGDGDPMGYEDITGNDLFTSASTFGGGSVDKWIASNSQYLTAFRNNTTGNEDAILAQICIRSDTPVSYSQLVSFLDSIKAEVPGAPLYVMPLDVSPQSSPTCGLSGYDRSVDLVNQAVENGIALLGPVLDPPYDSSETTDGCHPNDIGAARMTDTVQAFFGNDTTTPPPSSDDVPPTISITSPSNGETTMGIVNVTADATDNVGVTGVDFFLDGVQIGTTDTTPPFAISWDTLEETNGVYTLEAQAYDAAGNVGTSSPINGDINNSSSNAINIQVTPARTTCVAPCSIFFDATTTTADATNRPFHELNYSWNFDDANSGDWAWTGKPRNTATGAVSTHVFEAPGVHNVTLVVRDGNGNVATQQTAITIQDPDTFYSETNTYCFSTGSNFTGCPTNLASQHITTSTLQNVNDYVGANRRLLLRRGDTWSTGTSITLSGSGPSVLGAFGTCASPDDRGICTNAPKINVTSNTSSAIESSNSNPISDWRIMDIEASASTSSLSKGFNSSKATDHVLLLRMNIHDFGTLVFIDDGFRFKLTNITIADSDLQRAYTSPAGLWLNGKNISVLGTKIQNSEGSEHIIRTSYADGGVYTNNDLSEQANGKSVIKLHSPRPEYGLITEKVVISDNKFKGGKVSGATRVLTVKPDAACYPERSQIMTNVVVERNFFESTSITQNHVLVGAVDVTVRNNIFNMTLGSNQNAVTIEQCGSDPAPKNVAVINNTFYSASTGFTAIKVGVVDSLISATNNLVYAPNAGNPRITTGAIDTLSNLLLNSNQFVSSSFSSPADFNLNATSAAVDAGVEHPSLVCEFEQRVRSNISAIRDIGAFEQ